ncbi:hypothetical protein L1987_69979 [Smallanthus sonchifolius]|uniref:Uncharacterized protein n=1 Tax=Smallanthus sonchifolius TaxID=185202 RepID=A0ACB9B7H1_9ASTR|nr:hypothetical protein L1987_69979 [Smallanthus sonchifolius]
MSVVKKVALHLMSKKIHLPCFMSKQRQLSEMVSKADHKLVDTYVVVSCYMINVQKELKLLDAEISFETEQQLLEERLFALKLKLEAEDVDTFLQEYKNLLITQMNVEIAETTKEANVNLHKMKAHLEVTKLKFINLSVMVGAVQLLLGPYVVSISSLETPCDNL